MSQDNTSGFDFGKYFQGGSEYLESLIGGSGESISTTGLFATLRRQLDVAEVKIREAIDDLPAAEVGDVLASHIEPITELFGTAKDAVDDLVSGLAVVVEEVQEHLGPIVDNFVAEHFMGAIDLNNLDFGDIEEYLREQAEKPSDAPDED